MPQQQSQIFQFLKRSFLWAGSACGVIFLIAMVTFQQNITNHHVRYRYEPEANETGNESEANDVADTIRKRLAAFKEEFGLSQIAVMQSGQVIDLRFSTRGKVDEILFWVTMPGHVSLSLLHPDIQQPLKQSLEELPSGYVKKDYTKYMYRLSRPGDLKTEERTYVVTEEPLMTIDRFKLVDFAKVGLHSRTELTFEFLPEDAERFQHITALNFGRSMAMMVDGRLFFPPKEIRGPVEGGVVQVKGYFYNPPIRKLVEVLNTGALPGDLHKISHQMY